MYSRNMVDYHLIMDMIPAIARMYFLNQLGDLALSAAQSVGYLLPVCRVWRSLWAGCPVECFDVTLCIELLEVLIGGGRWSPLPVVQVGTRGL